MPKNIITRNMKPIARAGLSAKGIVYLLLGALSFMAAFGISGKSSQNTSKSGVFDFIYDQPAGAVLLWIVIAGLICYVVWRMIQAFSDSEKKGDDTKGLAVRGRYLFSGLVYASVAYSAFKMAVYHKKDSGSRSQDAAQEMLSQPMGQWLVGFAAVILLAVGVYQIYYGLSEKYRKHVNKHVPAAAKQYLLTAGKLGYIARGVVWLLFSYLFIQAALSSNSNEAGDTSKAFGMLSHSDYGPYFLALIGIGLMLYGLFNFIRARYEEFGK